MTDSSSPPTTNPTGATVDEIIHAAIFDVGLGIAEAALITQFPVLGVWGINAIFTFLCNKIGQAIYVVLSNMGVQFIIILQTDQEKTAYAAAEQALRLADLTGDPNAIAQATEAFKIAFRALIHYDGSAPAHS